MGKGGIFLALTVVLILAVFYYLSFEYERPEEPGSDRPPELRRPGLNIVEDCENNLTCLQEAVSTCKKVDFELSSPLNSSKKFRGSVVGKVLDKCQVYVFDPLTNESATCNIDESAFEIKDTKALRNICSGELAERLLRESARQ